MAKAKSNKAKYIIGIDLGTTNCTMSYAKAESDAQSVHIEQFEIPQIASAGVETEQFSLPSFLYFPLPEEIAANQTKVNWSTQASPCIGVFARDRGAELPSRLIASAKSWLCYAGVDRKDKLLPFGNDAECEKMSPFEACAGLLVHLQQAWDYKMPQDSFVSQQVLITVPASFDPSARQMIQEAAKLAGYPEIILLEEPQAAFYAWLHTNESTWRKQLAVGDTILVVDIGGGTTDFSLISVSDEKGNLELNRLAVGSHLLLGGDNMDLALAYLAKEKLEEKGAALSDWQNNALVHACRKAKETLLGKDAPESVDVAIQGRGSRIIGGSLKTTITKKQAQNLLVDGFMPIVTSEDRSPTERRVGMHQIGLPYAQDARITCQLAKFLSMTGENDIASAQNFIMPTTVLFNGGALKAHTFRERLIEVLNQWAVKLDKPSVKVLLEPDYDNAVSRGAVYYSLARVGKAIRIKAGSSRSYYIGVEDSLPAVPGIPTPLKAICIVPFGMEEGSEQELADQEFALILGEQATFRFFSHATPKLSNGTEPILGTIIKNWKQELTELPTVETMLDKTKEDGKSIRVRLKSRVTELGVLELWCVAPDGRQWKLEFDISRSKPICAMT